EAIDAWRRAMALRPGDANALNNLGVSLKRLDRIDQAIAAFGDALAAEPTFAPARSNLANALREIGKLDEALATYRQAEESGLAGANPPRQLREELAGGWNRLGCSLLEKRRFSDAIACYRRAVAIWPECAEAHSNLGMVLRDAGRIDEAIAALRQAVALKPDSAEIHSCLLFTFHFQPHCVPSEIDVVLL